MVVIKKTYISDTLPEVISGLWLKPVSGGFAFYLIDGGNAHPIKIVDDKGTLTPADDVVEPTAEDLIGSVQDKGTANTINGAKAYAQDAVDGVVGTADDTAEDLTLYGLKKYIDTAVGG